jgi:hypothetical protein
MHLISMSKVVADNQVDIWQLQAMDTARLFPLACSPQEKPVTTVSRGDARFGDPHNTVGIGLYGRRFKGQLLEP